MRGVATIHEDYLYREFGIDAELLIDHAWGREPTTMQDIKSYKPKTNCITSGQVLMRDYSFKEAEIIVKEMVDCICGEMVEKNLVTDSLTMCVGYSNSLCLDFARGSAKTAIPTNCDKILIPAALNLYRRIVNENYPVRRINITCNRVTKDSGVMQFSMFDDNEQMLRNKIIQETMIGIKRKHGKNSILKGTSYQSCATGMERNMQIGGHKSG